MFGARGNPRRLEISSLQRISPFYRGAAGRGVKRVRVVSSFLSSSFFFVGFRHASFRWDIDRSSPWRAKFHEFEPGDRNSRSPARRDVNGGGDAFGDLIRGSTRARVACCNYLIDITVPRSHTRLRVSLRVECYD